jgi:hypothetical protein
LSQLNIFFFSKIFLIHSGTQYPDTGFPIPHYTIGWEREKEKLKTMSSRYQEDENLFSSEQEYLNYTLFLFQELPESVNETLIQRNEGEFVLLSQLPSDEEVIKEKTQLQRLVRQPKPRFATLKYSPLALDPLRDGGIADDFVNLSPAEINKCRSYMPEIKKRSWREFIGVTLVGSIPIAGPAMNALWHLFRGNYVDMSLDVAFVGVDIYTFGASGAVTSLIRTAGSKSVAEETTKVLASLSQHLALATLAEMEAKQLIERTMRISMKTGMQMGVKIGETVVYIMAQAKQSTK